MDRKKFLKLLSTGAAGVAIDPSNLLSNTRKTYEVSGNGPYTLNLQYLEQQLYEFGCPYDHRYFYASPMVTYTEKERGAVGILPKGHDPLEIKLYIGDKDSSERTYKEMIGPFVIKDTKFLPFELIGSPLSYKKEISYFLEYRKGKEKWKRTPRAVVKTPFVDLDKGDTVEIIFISDDHTADDADIGKRILKDKLLRKQRITGHIFNRFARKLYKNPYFKPEPGSELAKLLNSWSMASTNLYIAMHENPHAVFLLGDTLFHGFTYKWPGLGLKTRQQANSGEKKTYAIISYINQRRKYSPLSYFIPIRMASGNHDGEQGFNNYDGLRDVSLSTRKKFWKQPGIGPFENGSPNEDYYAIYFGPNSHRFAPAGCPPKDDLMFLIMNSECGLQFCPARPEDYTLGPEQYDFVREIAEESRDIRYKFALQHRLIGSWPGGPDGDLSRDAYARGNAVLAEDYHELNKFGKELGFYINPNKVEQVQLTGLLMENDFNGIIYAHDHIFNHRMVEKNGKLLNVMCVGSSKNHSDRRWWNGLLWKHGYGDFGTYYADKVPHSGIWDFFGSSGYTKLIISKNGITAEYIRSAYNHPETNIPPDISKGDIIFRLKL